MEQKILNAFDSVRMGMDTVQLKQLETELKFALKSYKGYLNWLGYTTYPHANEIMKIVNNLMASKDLWNDAKSGIVQETIKRCKSMKARYISPLEVKKKYGMLRSFTYKFLGGVNKLSEDQNSGALIGGVTRYSQAGKNMAKNKKIADRLNKIKGVTTQKIYNESGKVINKQTKGRDINAIVTLIEQQCKNEKGIGINILSDDEFSKYPTNKKISAINQVMSYSERSKKFSLENDMVGEILLNRVRIELTH